MKTATRIVRTGTERPSASRSIRSRRVSGTSSSSSTTGGLGRGVRLTGTGSTNGRRGHQRLGNDVRTCRHANQSLPTSSSPRSDAVVWCDESDFTSNATQNMATQSTSWQTGFDGGRMNDNSFQYKIYINTTPKRLWRALTDPA